jgi:hypothetical protein
VLLALAASQRAQSRQLGVSGPTDHLIQASLPARRGGLAEAPGGSCILFSGLTAKRWTGLIGEESMAGHDVASPTRNEGLFWVVLLVAS